GVLQRKRYRRKDGEVVWADVTSFVVPATDSTPAFRVAVIVDITDRKRAEEALQEAQADLARLNRIMLLGERTASIAHEVNQRNGVRLQTRFAVDLPLAPADRVQLQQVITNLTVNAIEAMSSAGDRLRELTIASGNDNANTVFVEVQDTGPGIDPADLDRLFQSFYTTKPDGIGMGLAISRSIVEAHGGRLSAAPNQPHGAVFCFTLPVDEQGRAVPPR